MHSSSKQGITVRMVVGTGNRPFEAKDTRYTMCKDEIECHPVHGIQNETLLDTCWHKDQKAVCHCLAAILNLCEDSNQDAAS